MPPPDTAVRSAAMALHAAAPPSLANARLQRLRRAFQGGFFLLFLLAPALNLLRFDLTETQLWVMGLRWSLGIDDFLHGRANATQAALGIMLRVFLPALLLVGLFLGVAYRYGRLYCGWLCPHFSVVEAINRVLHRACGKFSLWDRHPTVRAGVDPQPYWWPLFGLSCVLMGVLWAITLLTYLLPPASIWGGLLQGTLTPNQSRFIIVASVVFSLEFAFARHLFCRFGCAVGLFQSLAWMANPRSMVVVFELAQARDCRSCDAPHGSACDRVCPMRLKPRSIKRRMFSCVQCGQCLEACEASQEAQQRRPVLQWQVGEQALRETLRQRKQELHQGR